MRVLIIGGVAGGASAATRARRVNPKAEIVIFERGPAISFANCGLPYHLGGEIEKRERLLVASPAMFKNRFGIDVHTEHEVVAIDRAAQQIEVKDLRSGAVRREPYDRLIISTGSRLRELPVFPKGLQNCFTLWSLRDLDRSMQFVGAHQPRRAVVVGAGFVGLEIAEQLKHRGIEVTVIEKASQVLPPLDADMASFVQDELVEQGVAVHCGREVAKVEVRDERVHTVVLDDQTSIPTDLVFVGIGVVPEVTLAQAAGLEIGVGIRVNQAQQTSDPKIYAVGDAAEYLHGPSGTRLTMPLAGPANRAGRIAGEHAVRGGAQFEQRVFGTSIVRVFGVSAGITGLSEKGCARFGIAYRTAVIAAPHHASYFPGAQQLTIKLLFSEPHGKVLGAEVVGGAGVDKRLDVIATVLHFGGTVKDLATLDLAYAPPFGSAKDPVHQVAMVALNHLDARPKLLPSNADLSGYQVVDVRSEAERRDLPLVGAIALPIDSADGDVRKRVSGLDRNQPVAVVCHSGKRAHVVASMLCGLGFREVANVTGGMMMRSRGVVAAAV